MSIPELNHSWARMRWFTLIAVSLRAERAKLKSCRDDMIVAQGKRGTSAALGYGRNMNMRNTRKANYARPPHRPCYGGWRGRENRRFGYTSQPSPETSLADALETLKPLEPRL